MKKIEGNTYGERGIGLGVRVWVERRRERKIREWNDILWHKARHKCEEILSSFRNWNSIANEMKSKGVRGLGGNLNLLPCHWSVPLFCVGCVIPKLMPPLPFCVFCVLSSAIADLLHCFYFYFPTVTWAGPPSFYQTHF